MPSRCVLKMDHHCPWVNNCVGHSNQPAFARFLAYVVCGCSHALVINANFLYRLFSRVRAVVAYRIAQNFKSDEFDEWLAIRQSFPFQPFLVNTFPMKPTINSSKFCSSKLRATPFVKIRQTFPPSKFCAIRYSPSPQIYKFPIRH